MNVVIGVTGSISAYKAVDVMRLFQKAEHNVSVILTESAARFIGPLTFETFAPGRVYTGMFDPYRDPLLHINLCRDNDLLLIAPATANILGKMAGGIADDLLSTVFLAFYKKVVVAPAMNSYMLDNPAVVENLRLLKSRGVAVIEPVSGSLACKVDGKGKLPPPEEIFRFCLQPDLYK